MAAANASRPGQKSSNVVPMNVRAPQPPLPRDNPAPPPTAAENHPPDEPGYGHGV
jgi:hypothetical protein